MTTNIHQAITLHQEGKLEEAEKIYRSILEVQPTNVDANNNLGVLLYSIGRLDEAETNYRKAIKLKPDSSQAHNNLGSLLKQLGKLDKAEASLRKAIALRPRYTLAARNILKLPVGQLDPKTLELCERAFPTPGEAAEDQVTYALFQANLLKHRGLLDQSFREFREANKLKFESIRNNCHLRILKL